MTPTPKLVNYSASQGRGLIEFPVVHMWMTAEEAFAVADAWQDMGILIGHKNDVDRLAKAAEQ